MEHTALKMVAFEALQNKEESEQCDIVVADNEIEEEKQEDESLLINQHDEEEETEDEILSTEESILEEELMKEESTNPVEDLIKDSVLMQETKREEIFEQFWKHS